jgi:hypothetical protein
VPLKAIAYPRLRQPQASQVRYLPKDERYDTTWVVLVTFAILSLSTVDRYRRSRQGPRDGQAPPMSRRVVCTRRLLHSRHNAFVTPRPWCAPVPRVALRLPLPPHRCSALRACARLADLCRLPASSPAPVPGLACRPLSPGVRVGMERTTHPVNDAGLPSPP